MVSRIIRNRLQHILNKYILEINLLLPYFNWSLIKTLYPNTQLVTKKILGAYAVKCIP